MLRVSQILAVEGRGFEGDWQAGTTHEEVLTCAYV
jgi:hypothetical protein